MKNIFTLLFVILSLSSKAGSRSTSQNSVIPRYYNFADTNNITLQKFSVNKTVGGNELYWKVNCLSTYVTFEMQRSAGLQNFETIYKEKASKARCASPFIYIDGKPLRSTNYYRLKIIDIDGSPSFSKILLSVNNEKEKANLRLQTNIVSSQAVLNYTSGNAEKIEWIIANMQGKIIKKFITTVTPGDNIIILNIADVAAGQYNLKGYYTNSKTDAVIFIKQ